jgi:DNA-binding response OmpR family regulator
MCNHVTSEAKNAEFAREQLVNALAAAGQQSTFPRMLEVGVASADGAASLRSASKNRVGIIDRDSGFVQTLRKRLQMLSWEHAVLSRAISPEALVSLRLNALVLDVATVGPDFWTYLEDLCRRFPALAIVVCTGPSSLTQRVRGLRLGVDAWVSKPCHPEELVCLVQAVLRRQRRADLLPVDPPAIVGEITIRADLHQAYVGERSVDLTAREFELLLLLAKADRVLERGEIYERVWGYAMAHGDRSVDVFVRKLRQKLRIASPTWAYIHTHFGVGYRFAPERQAPCGGLPVREGLENGESVAAELSAALG